MTKFEKSVLDNEIFQFTNQIMKTNEKHSMFSAETMKLFYATIQRMDNELKTLKTTD